MSNLITPVHTLNEQSYTFPAGTFGSNSELVDGLNAFLSSRFGWELDNGKPVASADGKIQVYAALQSQVYLFVRNANGVTLNTVAPIYYNQNITIYWHVSADGKTMYLTVHSGGAGTGYDDIILAETTDGSICAFVPFGTGINTIGADSLSYYKAEQLGSAQTVNAELYYTISKMPDVFSGGELASLYKTWSVKQIVARNHLVNFAGTVFRLVYSAPGTSVNIWFAFPVGD